MAIRLRIKHPRRIAAACIVIMGGVVASYLFVMNQSKPQSTPKEQVQSTVIPTTPTLHVAAMGDMLAHDTIVANAKTADGYDFTRYFQEIRPLYDRADVVFCNPETPAAGEKLGVSGYPTFNAPTEFARDLKTGAGCNLINLATNHIFDKGQAGIDATLEAWAATKPLAVAGANRSTEEQSTVRYFTQHGISVAFVAFADFSNSKGFQPYALNLYHDESLVRSLMKLARQNADVVIVSAHWGTEDSTTVNPDQTKAAQVFADLGADVVIGTGPHVLQPVTWLDGPDHKTLVWYSIGNMLSSQLQINELTGGIAQFSLTKKNGHIEIGDVALMPTYMSYDWSTADRSAQKLLTRSNLVLQPLQKADKNVSKMFPGETAATRLDFVKKTVGDAVTIP